jgi:hypothetical protein
MGRPLPLLVSHRPVWCTVYPAPWVCKPSGRRLLPTDNKEAGLDLMR